MVAERLSEPEVTDVGREWAAAPLELALPGLAEAAWQTGLAATVSDGIALL